MTEDPFVAHRNLLFTVAYEMLGSAADAEDVLQEAWLGWADVDHSQVRDPRAYLIRVVTRQALNQMRTLSRRREQYVGEWLPEPLLTSPEVAEDVELAESVSIAMLTVLETLGPTERAVFVLHEVFEMPHGEIAEAIGKSPVTVRQIARRAREHVAARRPRVRVGRPEQQAVVERGRTRGDVARPREPVGGRVRHDDGVAQRRACRPDRDRRRARRDEPRGGERASHQDLRDAQPAEADAAGSTGRTRQVTGS
jgi:RNA polymerase sigma factor (sigma-70 family)